MPFVAGTLEIVKPKQVAYNTLCSVPMEIEPVLSEIIGDILASSFQGVIVVTGAGSQGIAWLLEVPGASAFLLEALIPYSREAMLSLLGEEPEQFVSMETALAMARHAYERASVLASSTPHRVGLSCTATIVTNHPKRGAHRAYLAAQTGNRTFRTYVELEKGWRDRAGEEALVSEALLRLLACACGVRAEVDLALLPGDTLRFEKDPA